MIAPTYGRLLGDFEVGATYAHPWEVTVDHGMLALFAASFQDACPTYASAEYARELGFRARPLHPLVCLNLALSFSVHDVSEQAIAHLAYVDVRFPDAGFVGDTVHARSTVLDVKPSASGDKGVVSVRTALTNQHDEVLCVFERKALVRAGKLQNRPQSPTGDAHPVPPLASLRNHPLELEKLTLPHRARGFAGFFQDFEPGLVVAHGVGHTVGESEHMQLTTLVRNSHPLHFDEVYARESSFTRARVVYGGLVFGWTAALASRDVAGNAVWDLQYQAGAHPASVAAGDTIYAASKVLAAHDRGPVGEVTFALVGVKNLTARAAVEKHGDALFAAELGKKQDKIPEKVFEIQRTLWIRKR